VPVFSRSRGVSIYNRPSDVSAIILCWRSWRSAAVTEYRARRCPLKYHHSVSSWCGASSCGIRTNGASFPAFAIKSAIKSMATLSAANALNTVDLLAIRRPQPFSCIRKYHLTLRGVFPLVTSTLVAAVCAALRKSLSCIIVTGLRNRKRRINMPALIDLQWNERTGMVLACSLFQL